MVATESFVDHLVELCQSGEFIDYGDNLNSELDHIQLVADGVVASLVARKLLKEDKGGI